MLYYQGYTVSFQEVPDEISLVILVADCPHHCWGCHSPELQRPEGKDLESDLAKMIDEYSDVITCVCFMGEGRDLPALARCADTVHDRGLKVCVYSGSNELNLDGLMSRPIDYLKTGPYIEALGGLNSPTTNQRMYRLSDHADITNLFWKHD